MLRTAFDVPALSALQQDLEQIASQPEFWNDQQKAKKEMRKLDDVKAQLSKLTEWNEVIEDAQVSLELYELDNDDEILFTATKGLAKLKIDPALAGGVILTTITDIVGFISLLGIATLIL